MSKYGVYSGPYFPKCGKIRTRKNSVFGHFSHSVKYFWQNTPLDKRMNQKIWFKKSCKTPPPRYSNWNWLCLGNCKFWIMENERCWIILNFLYFEHQFLRLKDTVIFLSGIFHISVWTWSCIVPKMMQINKNDKFQCF